MKKHMCWRALHFESPTAHRKLFKNRFTHGFECELKCRSTSKWQNKHTTNEHKSEFWNYLKKRERMWMDECDSNKCHGAFSSVICWIHNPQTLGKHSLALLAANWITAFTPQQTMKRKMRAANPFEMETIFLPSLHIKSTVLSPCVVD